MFNFQIVVLSLDMPLGPKWQQKYQKTLLLSQTVPEHFHIYPRLSFVILKLCDFDF